MRGLLVFACPCISESSRRPAPATPDKEQGEGKKYYAIERDRRATESDVKLRGMGLHTMRAIAPQVFAYCQSESLEDKRMEPPVSHSMA